MPRRAGPIRKSRIVVRRFRVRPDFVFPKQRLAVFVDGCFWHACPRHSNLPANHRAFWKRKLAANQARDRQVNRTLRQEGWRVMRIWEHNLARRQEPRLLARLQKTFAARNCRAPRRTARPACLQSPAVQVIRVRRDA